MPGCFRLRPTVSGVVLSCSIVFAAASFASNLKDVRVGPHGDYTRVVLETDALSPYALNQTDGVVTIELQASATPKAVTAKSQQLSWVRVEPAGDSSLVKIQLKGPARVKQMVLTGPHRIVLDVFAEPAAAVQPEPVRERVVAKPEPVAAEPTRAASGTPTSQPGTEDEDALISQEATNLLGPETAPLPGDAIAATEGVPNDALDSGADAAAGAGTGDVLAQATPPPAAVATPTVTRVAKRKGVLDWLLDPWISGGLAIVMLALVVILWRRRPVPKAAPVEEELRAASLFGSAAAAPVEAEDATADSVGFEAPSESSPSEASGSAFEFEAPEVEPEKPDLGSANGASLSTIGAVTSTAAYETKAPISTGGLSMAELDRRLALLEQRLEEVIDAKDRLERQVSAQTEELRVQRAAIARTQRVLRTVVRPEDDQPSEPVLKS